MALVFYSLIQERRWQSPCHESTTFPSSLSFFSFKNLIAAPSLNTRWKGMKPMADVPPFSSETHAPRKDTLMLCPKLNLKRSYSGHEMDILSCRLSDDLIWASLLCLLAKIMKTWPAIQPGSASSPSTRVRIRLISGHRTSFDVSSK